MISPVPERFLRSLKNIGVFVMAYLALTGLHAIIKGSTPPPSPFVYGVVGMMALLGFANVASTARQRSASDDR